MFFDILQNICETRLIRGRKSIRVTQFQKFWFVEVHSQNTKGPLKSDLKFSFLILNDTDTLIVSEYIIPVP